MELYSRDISPFAARVRFSILAKGLTIRVTHDPDVASSSFADINPYKRVPVLVLDDGTSLPESEVIVEYLEDLYPHPPLRPVEPARRARARLIARAAELYLFPTVVELLTQPARANLSDELERQLGHLASLFEPSETSWHALGTSLSLADGALAPFFVYVDMLGAARGRSYLSAQPRLERFWEGAQRDPVAAVIVQEIRAAMMKAQARAQADARL